MEQVHQYNGRPDEHAVLREMFEARKRVFVDLLGWDVPVVDGRFEIDQFDDRSATYIVVTAADGRHLGSARLLSTIRPHILGTLYPTLCEGAPPCGPTIAEITRFCLDRRLRASERRKVRDQLVSAIVDHALATGIERYTGVAELGWLQQILAFGWSCRPLGAPKPIDGQLLGALVINISPATPTMLARAGIYAPTAIEGGRRHAA